MVRPSTPIIGAELAGALTLAALLQAAFIALGYVADNPASIISSGLRPYGALMLAALAVILVVMGRYGRGGLFGLAALTVLAHLAVTLYQQRSTWAAARHSLGERTLSVISFNVYNRNSEDAARVASALAESRADILVLTEATHLKSQMPRLRERFPHAAGCTELTYDCETVILSVHPVSEGSTRSIGPIFPNRFVSAKITIGSDTVTVVATHLTKPYFDNHGWTEIWRLAELIEAIPGPLLLAGDFNATPWSRSIVTLLAETQLLPAPIPVATWPSFLGGLGVPIDHMFTRAPMTLDWITPLPETLGSNHRGLIGQLRY